MAVVVTQLYRCGKRAQSEIHTQCTEEHKCSLWALGDAARSCSWS